MMRFIEGATLAHYTGDRDAKRAEVAEALEAFDARVPPAVDRPSATRRIDRLDAARSARTTSPATCSPCCCGTRTTWSCRPTWCCARPASSCWPAPTPRRPPSCGPSTTCSRLRRPTRRRRAGPHRPRLPPAVRPRDRAPPALEPRRHAVGARRRRARRAARHLEPGDKVVIDLMAVNRDQRVFGAARRPVRPPSRAPRRGGPLGPELRPGDARLHRPGARRGHRPPGRADRASDHLYGLVPVAVAAVLAAGGTTRPRPTRRSSTPTDARGYWGRYPVVF